MNFKRLLINGLLSVTLTVSASTVVLAQRYTEEAPLKVALVLQGTLGDKSMFDSAAAGVRRAVADMPVDVKIIEAGYDRSRWQPAIADAADGDYDVVIAGTFDMKPYLVDLTSEYPEKKFILYADVPDFSTGCCANVLAVQYRPSAAAYLAGYAAAKLTKTGTLATIAGMEVPIVIDFKLGFDQGAKAANPNIKILNAIAGSFSDPAKGKEIALAQIAQGADVIFPIAGGTGVGALQAARDKSALAVGVDSDLAAIYAYTDPAQANVILTSVEMRTGDSLYLALSKVVEGTAPFGTGLILGLQEGGVGISKNGYYEKLVPGAVRAEIEGLEEKIKSGQLVVDTAL